MAEYYQTEVTIDGQMYFEERDCEGTIKVFGPYKSEGGRHRAMNVRRWNAQERNADRSQPSQA